VLLHRAVANLGIDLAAADPAIDSGLLNIGSRVEFAHPLVRSAAYGAATAADRCRVHAALAEATDVATDPDRRAWHRAQATLGPDEDVADELEQSAGRAQLRGGAAAAAAFLQRAAALTIDPLRKSGRALAAAEASLEAGAFDAALALTTTAEALAGDELRGARIDLLRGQVAFASGSGGDRAALLLRAARRLEPFDLPLARQTYLTAWRAAGMAGRLAGEDILLEICEAIKALPPTVGPPRPLDVLLDGLALLTTEGRAAAAPTLQRAAHAFVDMEPEDVLRWGWVAAGASDLVWDLDGMHAICTRQVQLARSAGAIGLLPMYLAQEAIARTWVGDFAGAAALVTEADGVAAATGSRLAEGTALRLKALQGVEAEAAEPIARAIEAADADGGGNVAAWAYWAAAVLYNGLGRYAEAAAAARSAADNPFDPWNSMWALPELVEAAARAGDDELALHAVDRLIEMTQPCDNDAARGFEARSRALVSRGEAAGALYREAIDRLMRTGLRPDLARTHLLYGEWLRREGQRVSAREQLRTAYEMLDAIGMHAFAERARRELLATGEKARKRTDDTRDELTAQEVQIARLARDGYSNPEIGALLFLSPRTVEWHLRKVFVKLQISSRGGLRTAMPRQEREPTPA